VQSVATIYVGANIRYHHATEYTTMDSISVGYLNCRLETHAEGVHASSSAQASSSSSWEPSSNAAACPTPCRVATIDATSCLSAHSDVVPCRRCRSTPWSDAPGSTSRACSGSCLCSPTVFLDLPCRSFSPCLLFCCPALCSLLTMYLFLLDVDQVLRRALPLWVENQALVVFGLGKYASPCLEQG
jgi:hypothetical protein